MHYQAETNLSSFYWFQLQNSKRKGFVVKETQIQDLELF